MEKARHPIAARVLLRAQLQDKVDAWKFTAQRVTERSTLPEHTAYADGLNMCATALEYILKTESE